MVAAEAPPERTNPSSLTMASGLLGVSTIATRLAMLVVMALLAAGAGTAAVGYYGLATLTASFTAAALSLGFPTYLTREVPAGNVTPAQVARIHFGRLAVLVLAAGAAYALSGGTVPSEMRLGFLCYFLASLLEQWNETAWVLVRGTRSAWREPATNSVAGFFLVAWCAIDAIVTGGLSFDRAALYFILAAVGRSVAALVLVRMPQHLRAPARLDVPAHVRRAVPYLASDVLGLLYFRGDVFVLATFVAASELGEYVSAASIIGPAVQVAASMGIGALAYASQRLIPGRPRVDDPRTIFLFFRTAGQAAAGLMYLGLPPVVLLLFGDEGDRILLLSMILTLFLALRFANFGLSAILLAHGKATSRLLVLILSTGANVGLNLALDGRYGAYGAAWATVLTELVVAGSMLWFLRSRELVRPVVIGVCWVAIAAAVLVSLFFVAPTVLVAVATGLLLLATAAANLLSQRRAARTISEDA